MATITKGFRDFQAFTPPYYSGPTEITRYVEKEKISFLDLAADRLAQGDRIKAIHASLIYKIAARIFDAGAFGAEIQENMENMEAYVVVEVRVVRGIK